MFLTSVCGFGQDAGTEDPPELAALQEQNVRNLERASIPILREYLQGLEGLEQEYTRERKFDAITLVQAEGKEVQRQIDEATKAADMSRPVAEFLILSASYGAAPRWLDVAAQIRKAWRTGQATMVLNTDTYRGDPAPYVPKQTKIVYSINGKREEKFSPEGHVLNFNDELK